MAGHVSGRPGLQETGAELDRESVATTLTFEREKISKHKRCAFVEREKSPKRSLNGKLTRPSEERERGSAKIVPS